ncbi:hypothetical protein ACIGW8_38335 [Streptomyces sioyaensis]|uniref:hypothetical protein n=1 Tax=Streptomyces sioyaensis TaxID=67364 RepID=UPI0037D2E091
MRPPGWNVDSKDFEGGSVQTIESTVRAELNQPHHTTILFHDDGGDRSRTVEALDRLQPWMQSLYAGDLPPPSPRGLHLLRRGERRRALWKRK